ncbi:UNVERIFIED_CONTAM: hypothetical protein PYX00_007658 [Menopon gallinae]|uniref:Uridine diphosphate glucose pyrophosphatase NUDT14 n=1 Tax=Menopon gallinae TaxID=328185 RepID=A0AAW2HK31_9NEOP
MIEDESFKPRDSVGKMKIVPLTHSPYLKPFRAEFEMNGRKRFWDMLKIHDSVSVLLFNVSRRVLILVRQFRPAMYIHQIPSVDIDSEIDPEKHDLRMGYSLELCAGLVDKDFSLEEIARQEVLEECGYDIPVDSLKKVHSYRGVGITGQKGTIFYAEVTDEQKVSEGGGLREEGESIEVVEMTIPSIKKYISNVDILSPAVFVSAIQWFLSEICCE